MGATGRHGGNRRHADVRAGASGRRGRDQEQRGQPDVAEHEPGEAACHGGGEAPDRDGREREHVHPIEYPS